MKLDPIVLGNGCVLDGSEMGILRPNDNVIADGCSGCGKSTSLLLPTMGRMEYMNPIASYAKEEDAYMMGNYMASKGYQIWYLNVTNPEKSNVSFDPICFMRSQSDIEGLSSAIVMAVLAKTVDSFWNTNSIQLLKGIIEGAMMIHENAGMADVLEMFDMTDAPDSKKGADMSMDDIYQIIESGVPNCQAVKEYNSWRAMPERTAASVRATLKGALNAVFPEEIRNLMRDKPQIDFVRFGKEKIALFIITDATEEWQEYYSNIFWYTCIKELKIVANSSPGHHLERPARLYFDDFACTSAINDIHKNISLTRSYGISYFILLQSQTQLESIYDSERASVIRQNCPVQLYFPGGFDDKSCELVSKKMNIPYEDVLYSKMGQVFIMTAGRKPIILERYDTFNSIEYQDYLAANGMKSKNNLKKIVSRESMCNRKFTDMEERIYG